MQRIKLILILIAGLGLTSCLKESEPLDPAKSNNVIELYAAVPDKIASPTTSTFPLFTQAFEIVNEADFEVVVNYAGNSVAPADITVNLALDGNAIDTYNAENSDHFVMMPDELFEFDSYSLVIKKGERQAKTIVKLKTIDFDLAEKYALPIKIESASQGIISGNFGTVIYGIAAKNKYDGRYEMHGTFVDQTNANFKYWGDQEFWLETVDATHCYVWNETLGTYGYLFLNGTSTTYYGSFGLLLEFDPATGDILSAVNAYGQPSANGRSAALDPTGVNNWNPTTKEVKIKYFLLQPGTTVRSKFDETWTYLGARP